MLPQQEAAAALDLTGKLECLGAQPFAGSHDGLTVKRKPVNLVNEHRSEWLLGL